MWWMAPGVRLRLGLFPQRSSFSSTTSRTAGSVQLCESLDDRQEERQNRDLAAPSDARIANDSDVLRETSSSMCGWPAGSACVLGSYPERTLSLYLQRHTEARLAEAEPMRSSRSHNSHPWNLLQRPTAGRRIVVRPNRELRVVLRVRTPCGTKIVLICVDGGCTAH